MGLFLTIGDGIILQNSMFAGCPIENLVFNSGTQGTIINGTSVFTNFTGNLILPDNVIYVKDNAFSGSNFNVLVKNKNATIQSGAFNGGVVYTYSDSLWASSYSGRIIYFADSLTADPSSITLYDRMPSNYSTKQVSVVPNTITSSNSSYLLSAIPEMTWQSNNYIIAMPESEQTEKGVYQNKIIANNVGATEIVVTMTQLGADIFGPENVPTNPDPVTITVTVSECPEQSGLCTAKSDSCLQFSADGSTVVGTDGTCTVVTSEDFGSATKIAAGTYSTGTFASSSDTLIAIEFPATLKEIGNYAFQDLNNLKNVSFSKSTQLETIGFAAFSRNHKLTGTIDIPPSVKEIKGNAFFSCDNIQILKFSEPSALENIGSRAFEGCLSITNKLIIPSSVKEIGDNAFFYNKNISGLSFGSPSSLETIGKQSFMGLLSATGDLVIPSSVLAIKDSAFKHFALSDSLDKYYKGEANSSGWGSAISDLYWDPDSSYTGFSSLEFEPGSKISSIEKSAFSGYITFSGELAIPDSISTIGSNAFAQTGFSSIKFPDGIEKIWDEAFWDMPRLHSINIPSSVIEIGAQAFYGCESLSNLVIPENVTKYRRKAPCFSYGDERRQLFIIM